MGIIGRVVYALTVCTQDSGHQRYNINISVLHTSLVCDHLKLPPVTGPPTVSPSRIKRVNPRDFRSMAIPRLRRDEHLMQLEAFLLPLGTVSRRFSICNFTGEICEVSNHRLELPHQQSASICTPVTLPSLRVRRPPRILDVFIDLMTKG